MWINIHSTVATVLTACGIETGRLVMTFIIVMGSLQQYLPLAVLKRGMIITPLYKCVEQLQQYLPLAVLKLPTFMSVKPDTNTVATVLTACGIETNKINFIAMPPRKVATVLTACGIETQNLDAIIA